MNKKVHDLFSASIENRILAADMLEKNIAHAAAQLVECLLSNGKIFIVGQGEAAAQGQRFASVLLNYVELERPALPVIALSAYDTEKISVRQMQALGQTEDMLIVLSASKSSACMIEMIQTAHDKEMRVVALTCGVSGLSDCLIANDSEVCVPGGTGALIHETQLFVLDCFCNLIEQSLFGQMVE